MKVFGIAMIIVSVVLCILIIHYWHKINNEQFVRSRTWNIIIMTELS